MFERTDRICAQASVRITKPHTWIAVSILSFLLSIFYRWPDYESIPSAHPTWFVSALDWQTHHPLEKIPLNDIIPAELQAGGFASHLNKRDLRQIFPLLGYATGLHFDIYIVVNHAAGLLFFILLAIAITRQTSNAGVALFSTLAYSMCYAGAHFFDDYFLGDGLSIVCLLGAVVARRPVIIALLVGLAAMTDERALAACLLTYLFWQLQRDGAAGLSLKELIRPTRQGWAVIVGCAIFLAWRTVLTLGFDLQAGTSDLANARILNYHARHYPDNLLSVYSWLGIVVLAAVGVVFQRNGAKACAILTAFTTFAVSPAILVYDFQRSVAFGATIIVIAFGIISTVEPRLTRFIAVAAVIGNALINRFPDTLLQLDLLY